MPPVQPDESSRDLANIRRVKSFLRVVNSLELPQAEDSLGDSHSLQSPSSFVQGLLLCFISAGGTSHMPAFPMQTLHCERMQGR